VTVAVIPLPGLPMIRPGDDLGRLLGDAVEDARVGLKAGDVVAVCQKVVSKAEGAVVDLAQVTPSPLAEELARQTHAKDARAIEVVLRETRRIVRNDRGHLIVETRHGWVCANAGVDESNGLGPGMVTLLPRDADASAATLRAVLGARFGVEVAVVVTDTFGRPWREGQVEVAIGVAGMEPLLDLRGAHDLLGRELQHTVIGLADEIAAAAGLVMGKASGIAAAIVRGVGYRPGPGGAAAAIVRRPELDLFR
jgi:coenzyme F420-0:L-glutamate ligase/coenzyme F420-1:gamma-L-glutamate ligase